MRREPPDWLIHHEKNRGGFRSAEALPEVESFFAQAMLGAERTGECFEGPLRRVAGAVKVATRVLRRREREQRFADIGTL